MMKNKTLLVNFENEIYVGHNNAISATVVHQIAAFTNSENKTVVEVEFLDIVNVEFMGEPIKEGYTEYNKFKASMLALGVDVSDLIDKKCIGIISEDEVDKVREMFNQGTNK